MNKFPADLIEYLSEHTLIKVKGGSRPRSFLNIWIVVVDQRLFSRSWDKKQRSWYTAFLAEGVGQIQYGDLIIDVSGKKIDVNDDIHELINQAYLEKYTQPDDVPYAIGFAQDKYKDVTLEFEFVDHSKL